MLVLHRKKNQEIVIGKDIRIMVVGIRGNNVRLGITAPENIEVDRLEIRESKDAKKIAVKKASKVHVVVWRGEISGEWIVSIQIEPGIRRRISSHRDKVEAVIAGNHAADHRGLDLRIMEPLVAES